LQQQQQQQQQQWRHLAAVVSVLEASALDLRLIPSTVDNKRQRNSFQSTSYTSTSPCSQAAPRSVAAAIKAAKQ